LARKLQKRIVRGAAVKTTYVKEDIALRSKHHSQCFVENTKRLKQYIHTHREITRSGRTKTQTIKHGGDDRDIKQQFSKNLHEVVNNLEN
jgi:phage host-nuclease inhibitor protein Gam